VFYADDGGFQATTEEDEPSDILYFVGVIDILTPYNYVKKIEHLWKGMTLDKVSRRQCDVDARSHLLTVRLLMFVEGNLGRASSRIWCQILTVYASLSQTPRIYYITFKQSREKE
jgi:hypothetical protein